MAILAQASELPTTELVSRLAMATSLVAADSLHAGGDVFARIT